MCVALEKPATPATSLMPRDLTCNKTRNMGATRVQQGCNKGATFATEPDSVGRWCPDALTDNANGVASFSLGVPSLLRARVVVPQVPARIGPQP